VAEDLVDRPVEDDPREWAVGLARRLGVEPGGLAFAVDKAHRATLTSREIPHTTSPDFCTPVHTEAMGPAGGKVNQAMRLGLFDPCRLGPRIRAEQGRDGCGLDGVWFVVAGAPPHKPGGRTAVTHRLEMARIAVAGHPAFEVSDIEAGRPGPHYSVETLEQVR